MEPLEEDDDGFASCGEEEKGGKEEEKTGDAIHDFYLGIKTVKNKEDRSKYRPLVDCCQSTSSKEEPPCMS
jgi:hypothetical protein